MRTRASTVGSKLEKSMPSTSSNWATSFSPVEVETKQVGLMRPVLIHAVSMHGENRLGVPVWILIRCSLLRCLAVSGTVIGNDGKAMQRFVRVHLDGKAMRRFVRVHLLVENSTWLTNPAPANLCVTLQNGPKKANPKEDAPGTSRRSAAKPVAQSQHRLGMPPVSIALKQGLKQGFDTNTDTDKHRKSRGKMLVLGRAAGACESLVWIVPSEVFMPCNRNQ